MNAWRHVLAFAAVLVGMAAAAAQPAMQCQGTQKPMAVAELMFGRNIGGRLGVSELQWRKFLDREITPRFPNGLSVLDAKGQWHDTERHIIVREPSKIVIVVLTGKADDDDQLKAVIEAYKASFKQQSVGLIVRPACVAL